MRFEALGLLAKPLRVVRMLWRMATSITETVMERIVSTVLRFERRNERRIK
jgi:hypothetical protein